MLRFEKIPLRAEESGRLSKAIHAEKGHWIVAGGRIKSDGGTERGLTRTQEGRKRQELGWRSRE